MVFTRIADGDAARLWRRRRCSCSFRSCSLPVFLVAFADDAAVAAIDWTPFAEAFVLLIVTRWVCRSQLR